MRRWLLIPIFFLLSGVASANVPKNNNTQELDETNFAKGVDVYHDPSTLPAGYTQDALNVYFDAQTPVQKRKGYSLDFSTKSYAFNTMWAYTDGTATSWLIVRASDSIVASNSNNVVVQIATVSASNLVDEVNAFGSAYFVDQTQGVYYWNGTSTTYVANSPKGSIITQFHNRVMVAGAAVPNGNQLYASKYLDGTTWTIGPNPNDPAQFTIGLQDNFDNITAMYAFLDTLYVTKYYSVNALYGFDNTNFQVSIITRECGCVDKYSFQAFNKGLVFMSLRGLEFFDGYNCNRISDPVKPKIDSAISISSFKQQSWVQSSQSDFQNGVSSPTNNLSTTISPGDVIVSSFSGTDQFSADFASGTLNNVVIGTNTVMLSTDAVEIVDNSWELCTGWDQGCTATPQVGDDCTVNAKDGVNVGRAQVASTSGFPADYTTTVTLIDSMTAANYGSVSWGYADSCVWTQRTITVSPSAVRHLVYLQGSTSAGGTAFNSNSFIANGNNVTFYSTGQTFHRIGIPNLYAKTTFVDLFQGTPRSDITTGSFTSRTFDVVYTSYGYVYPTYNYTVNTTTPTFVLQQGSSLTGPWTDLIVGTGTSTNFSNEYLRYIATFTITSADNALTTLNSANVLARSTGTYYSAVNHTLSMNSWGVFNVNDASNGGSIAYFVRASTNSFSVTSATPAWTSQTKNSQITVSTGNYMQMSATFTITSATHTPTLNDFTFNWYSGNVPAPMSSVVFDNRYMLSLTTSPFDTANDAVIVLNTSYAYSIFDLRVGGFVVLNNLLYHADSQASGNVYLDNQGYLDNGHSISAYIKTRDFNLGSSLVADTLFDSMWLAMDNLGSYNVGINYFLDKVATSYTLATVSQSEFGAGRYVKIPFPQSTSNPGVAQSISFRLNANDANEPWQFSALSLLYHERPVQE